MQQKIDMHMHSTASDGTDSIPELIERVRESGIRIFSVTDHDTIKGALEMENMVPPDMLFVRGIEFSCITKAGKCHILAYGYDPENNSFQGMLEKGSDSRKEKMERRILTLEVKFHIDITDEEKEAIRAVPSAGKPHLGNLLVKKGYAKNIDEAIHEYLNRLDLGSDRLDGEEVVAAILDSGGIPVWAHPLGGTGEKPVGREEFLSQLELLESAGLMALECYYSKYSDEEIDFLLYNTRKKNLLVSGGSDYHGKNKDVPLGKLNKAGREVPLEALTIVSRLWPRKLS